MRASHWLIGCALCIAGIGAAGASSLDTHSLDAQDMDSSTHASLDGASASGSNGGDALGLSRDCPQNSGTDTSDNTSGTSTDHSGGASSAPMPNRRPHLGWQSLLPGSIQ